MKRSEAGCGGGTRSDPEIQKREVCVDLQSSGRSRNDESGEEDLLRGHGFRAREDAAVPVLAAGGVHLLGERGGDIQEPTEKSEVAVHDRDAYNKRSTAPGACGSPALSVTGAGSRLIVSEDAQPDREGDSLSRVACRVIPKPKLFDPGDQGAVKFLNLSVLFALGAD